MGYIRDEETGKFVEVEGVLEDDAELAAARAASPARPAPTAAVRINWLPWVFVVVLVALLGLWGVRSFKDSSESIRRIRNHAAAYDGREIVLKGRVGEVFQVGGSWAFYLEQGRDTIVVYSRGTRPLDSRSITVRGSISMGYMDGVPRPALFARETTQ